MIWEGDIPKLPAKPVNKDKTAFGIVAGFRNDSLQISEANKGVAGVFVYLERAPKGYKPKEEKLKVIQFGIVGKTFAPRNIVLRTGQDVLLMNDAKAVANVHTKPQRNSQWNSVLKAKDRGSMKFQYSKAEVSPVRVAFYFHAWMTAYQLPLDHPFAAVTDGNGNFTIRGLPPGEHKLKVWHETTGQFTTLTVKVPAESVAKATQALLVSMQVRDILKNDRTGSGKKSQRRESVCCFRKMNLHG